MLDQMMEKLYVISEQGTYHLKVENDAIPISELIEQRKLALSVDSGTLSNDEFDRFKIEAKCKEIQASRDYYLADSKV